MIHAVSLCAGVGAMDLGVGLALGGRARTLCYVEREAFPAAVLVARMADAALDRAPVFDDLVAFGRDTIGGARVDLLTSGLPCQPYSNAGARKGNDDERALWPEFVRITDELEPAIVFLENVPPFLKHAEPVWRELRRLGFEWAPPLLHTASEAGAPHIRRRFFAVAAHRERIERRGISKPPPDARRERLERLVSTGSTSGPTRRGRRAKASNAVPDADGRGRAGEWSGWVLDRERSTLRHDADRCGDGCRTCGTPWETESPFLRVDAGPSDRVERLRAVGNVGTAPVVYALAFRRLLEELGITIPEF